MSMFCCYKDCQNQHKPFSSKPFFNLPIDSRREIWIKNSGNENTEDIDWNRRKMFCEDHFDQKYIRRQFNRTTLRRDAVPYVYSADSQEVEFIEMAESEEDEDSTQLKYIELEQKNSNADNDDNHDSFVIVVDNNTQQATRRRNEIPKRKLAKMRVDQHSQQSDPNQKTDDDDFELAIPERRETPKRMISVLKEPGLRFIATKRPHEGDETVEKQLVIKKPSPSIVVNKESTNKITAPAWNADLMVSSTEKTDSNNEETYFALSLVSVLKRLSPHKRAIAKCHILSYLTELEYGPSELPN